MRLPEFDGSGNVEGFLTVFERNCRILGMDQETMLGSLMGKLTGAAASWLQGHEGDTLYWDYTTLRQQLVEHFGGEKMTHVRALQCLKQRSDLVSHNEAFTKKAAAASKLVSAAWMSELYLSSLSNHKLREDLKHWQHLKLQQLQAKALDLEVFNKTHGAARESRDTRGGV